MVDLAERLSTIVDEQSRGRDRILVGIEGPDAAGKTTLADRLAAAVTLPAVRASVDDFHQPREVRYRRGELSAEGYYRDSFDYSALVDDCVSPFQAGAVAVRTAAHDERADVPLRREALAVPARAVLIVDGVFLLRNELRRWWTLSVYLRVSDAECLRRGLRRDAHLYDSADELRHRYVHRYLSGQALYRKEADPEAAAQVLVDNTDAAVPRIERWPTALRP